MFAIRSLTNRWVNVHSSLIANSLCVPHRAVIAGGRLNHILTVCHHHRALQVTLCNSSFRTSLSNSNLVFAAHASRECYNSKRFKHRSTKSNKVRESAEANDDNEEEDDDDGDDEAEEDDNDYSSIHFKEDANLPLNYKELKVHLKSPRLDAIVSSGIGIARNQVDDIFYGSRLKLNGERVLKKSKQMKAGDYVDLVVSGEAEAMKVKRVRIVKISEGRTSGEKLKIFLRAWRSPVSIT